MVPFEVMCHLAVRGFKPLDQIESGSKFCYLRRETGKLPGQLKTDSTESSKMSIIFVLNITSIWSEA